MPKLGGVEYAGSVALVVITFVTEKRDPRGAGQVDHALIDRRRAVLEVLLVAVAGGLQSLPERLTVFFWVAQSAFMPVLDPGVG